MTRATCTERKSAREILRDMKRNSLNEAPYWNNLDRRGRVSTPSDCGTEFETSNLRFEIACGRKTIWSEEHFCAMLPQAVWLSRSRPAPRIAPTITTHPREQTSVRFRRIERRNLSGRF